MEQLQNGYTLRLCEGAFPLSTDSVALAAFTKLPKSARVLDLCAGCGTLGLMLCAKDRNCQVTGVEINALDHQQAVENIRENALVDRMQSICGDIASAPIQNGYYHICISNPPYFSGGPASTGSPTARRDDLCPPEVLFKTAAKALQWGGEFYLVHRPEQLAHLCALASKEGLEAKELCLLHHRTDSPVSLILLKFKKGGKPGLVITQQALHNPDGTPTDYYNSIYHTGA